CVGVAETSLYVAVVQKLLDQSLVAGFFIEPGSEGVAEIMNSNSLHVRIREQCPPGGLDAFDRLAITPEIAHECLFIQLFPTDVCSELVRNWCSDQLLSLAHSLYNHVVEVDLIASKREHVRLVPPGIETGGDEMS